MNLKELIQNIEDLVNVNIPSGTGTGDILVYDLSTDTWIAQSPSAHAHGINDLSDVDFDSGTPIDNDIMRYNSASGTWKAKSANFLPIDSSQRLGWRFAPTENAIISLIGWNIQTNIAASLTNATPVTAGEPGFHSHFIIDVSGASGLPFNITVTGRSVDESTGVTTPGDTEIINITANGYYQTTKSWIDAVVFSVSAGKSCTIDVYRNTYWDRGNQDFCITGCRFEWKPDAGAWSIRLEILKVNDNGSLIAIDDVTFASTDSILRADNTKYGKYKRGNYNTDINGAGKEGIIVRVDVTNISDFYVEVKYHE